MTFDEECAALVQRYAIYSKDRILTREEILAQPRYKRVWAWWQALAHYQMNNYYKRLEDAPDGISTIHVMGKTCKMYKWNNEYEFVQEMTKESCKGIYGQ